jgi:BirA family biotin operon repressor/biotin-[acetyl-CoA-carboxylase] ligase
MAPFRPLSATESIQLLIGRQDLPRPRLFLCGHCSSSLDIGWWLAAAQLLDEWDGVAAMSQWAGRGQRRRAWQSPPGNLYLTWRWPLLSSEHRDLLPLLVGGCVAQALQSVVGVETRIKWPNDLLVDGHKVAGVLVECRDDVVLVGLGLNVTCAPPPSSLVADGTAMSAISLRDLGIDMDPLAFWGALVDHGQHMADMSYTTSDPRVLLAPVESRLAWRGQTISASSLSGAAVRTGTLAGLAPDGSLQLINGTEEITIRSGEITRLK